MIFEVHLGTKAQKFMKTAEKTLHDRLFKKLERLGDDPFPPDAKKVAGQKEKTYRVRVGDYRILYLVLLEERTVLVVDIDKRPKVYGG